MSDEDVAIAEELRAKDSPGMRYARALGAAEASLAAIRIWADCNGGYREIAMMARLAEANIARLLKGEPQE